MGEAPGYAPIPLVVKRKDGDCADYGFAQRAWVVETFQWLSGNAPPPHLHRLLGLMLGYSADAIAIHDECESGKMFDYAILEQEALEPNPPLGHL